MKFKKLNMIVLLIMISALLVACGGGKEDSAATPSATTSDAASGDAKVIDVTLTDFAITPAVIELQAGQPVQLVVTNAGPTIHDLVIAGLGLNVETMALETGQTETLTFTPNRTGTIETFCSIPGHKALGMVGSIQVE